MEFNRNHFFLTGVVLLLLGYQFRVIESFTLNEPCSKFIELRVRRAKAAVNEFQPAAYSYEAPSPPRRIVKPPRWLGLAMISVGFVLVLHSLAMRRPG